jgi:predicted regulator of Ras-like GTPase activity (Roadblock/LC7/MglB family)
MKKSRTDLMVDHLRDMQINTPDVEASAIVSVDGLSIASFLPAGVEEDRVSAMSAAMLSLGERIAGELGRGVLDQIYVKGKSGYIVLAAIGDEAVLTVMAHPNAKLGLVFLEMRRTVENLQKFL